MTAAPAKLNFGSIVATASSRQKKLTLTNVGKVNAAIGQIVPPAAAPSSDFAFPVDLCSNKVVPPKKNCSLEVVFAPALVGGPVSKPLNIPYNGSSPLITLQGKAIAAVLTAPKSVTLASTAAGTTSTKASKITIANNTPATGQLVATYALANSKIVTDGCVGTTLAPKAKCVVSVEFSPPSGTNGKSLTDSLSYNFDYGANVSGVFLCWNTPHLASAMR